MFKNLSFSSPCFFVQKILFVIVPQQGGLSEQLQQKINASFFFSFLLLKIHPWMGFVGRQTWIFTNAPHSPPPGMGGFKGLCFWLFLYLFSLRLLSWAKAQLLLSMFLVQYQKMCRFPLTMLVNYKSLFNVFLFGYIFHFTYFYLDHTGLR